MAVNPMQRKTRTAFLLGLLIGLLFLIVVVFFGWTQNSKLKSDLKEERDKSKDVLVLSRDVKANEPITPDMLVLKASIYHVDNSNIANITGTAIMEGEDGEQDTKVEATAFAKINIPAGSILTNDMIKTEGAEIDNSLRVVDIAGVTIPPKLEINDTVDLRMSLPTGEDYVVVAKKRVIDADDQIIWLELNESEINTLTGAMIDNYLLKGTNMYLTVYTDPGVQDSLKVSNYPLNDFTFNKLVQDINAADKPTFTNDVLASLKILYERQRDMPERGVVRSNMQEGWGGFGIQSEDAAESIESGARTIKKVKEDKRKKYIEELQSAVALSQVNQAPQQ